MLIGSLELLPGRHLANERIGGEQHVVIEEDVVDPHDALVAQLDVIGAGVPRCMARPRAKWASW